MALEQQLIMHPQHQKRINTGENPCVVLGSIGFHRLAKLLFDRPIHILLDKQVSEFGDLKDFSVVDRGRLPHVTIVEEPPKVYQISSSCGQVDVFMSPDVAPDDADQGPDPHPIVSIAGLPIVDPDSLSNDLVREIAQDADSRSKLKRFKAFVHKNYRGEPLSFIQDDLETRILDYRLTAKKWGITTIDSTFSISAADKVLSGACAGLVSTVFGMPLIQAATVGLVATLGATTLKITFGRKSLKINQSQDDICYLADIQDKTKL